MKGGVNLRTLMIEKRKKLRLTQEQVSKEIGVSRNTYTSYETGAITPSLEVAIKIKKVLKTNDDGIFLIKDVMSGDEESA